MELSASAVAINDPGLIAVSFYDRKRLYGVTLSAVPGQDGIELMVADQSCYQMKSARIELRDGRFRLTLPPGTIPGG